MLLITILNIFIPLLLGVLCLRTKLSQAGILYFAAAYFMYIGLGELAGYLIKIFGGEKANVYFYNIFIPTNYIIRFLFFYFILNKKTHKQLSILFAVLYLILLGIEQGVMEYKPLELHFISYCFAVTAVIIVAMLYLASVSQTAAILNFKEDIIFWFCIATITFQLFTFPFYALMDAWFLYQKIGNTYWLISISFMYLSYFFYYKGIQCQLNKK